MNEHVNLLVGLAFVVFFSYQRFNTPITNRCTTTAERFRMATGLYCLLVGSAFLLVAQFPHLIAFFLQGSESSEVTVTVASTSLHVALLFTVLLPRIPILKEIDAALLKFTQDLANIPSGVRDLCETLRKTKMQISNAVEEQVEGERIRLGIGDIRTDMAPSYLLLNHWKETAALFLQVDQWKDDSKMDAFAKLFEEDWQTIRAQYEQVSEKLKDCLEMQGTAAPGGSHEGNLEFVRQYQKMGERFRHACTALLDGLDQDIITYVGKGIYHSETTSSDRSNRLASLGFSLPLTRQGVNANQITFLVCAVSFVFVISSMAFRGQVESIGKVFVMSMLIALKHGLAVVCVVLPKSWWSFARHTHGKTRPWSFYVGASLVAVLIGFSLSMILNACLLGSLKESLEVFVTSKHPWLLMTFGSALATAFLVDNPPWRHHPRLQRWLEGMLLAGIFVVVGWMTHGWLQTLKVALPAVPLLAKVGIIGFILGSLVPSWYRDSVQFQGSHTEHPVPEVEPLPQAQPPPLTLGPQGTSITW